jgi:hypothetical protein
MVVVMRPWDPKPVYHAWNERSTRGDSMVWLTDCGLSWRTQIRLPDRTIATKYVDGNLMRADHAEKFARPCRRCYVTGRAPAGPVVKVSWPEDVVDPSTLSLDDPRLDEVKQRFKEQMEAVRKASRMPFDPNVTVKVRPNPPMGT